MNWTVGDILPEVARHADGTGVCIETPEGRLRALKVYNDCIEELMADDSWDGATDEVEFDVCDGCIALPSQFESIRALTIDSRPAPVRPGGWRYIQGGAGLTDGCNLHEIEDMGDGFATARDLTEPMQLLIYSDKPETGMAQAVLQGVDTDGKEVSRGQFPGLVLEPGERIQIRGAGFAPIDGAAAQPLVTRATFVRRPSVVTKTETVGHVYLLGYKAGQDPVWLATYRPSETRPSYRRYRLKKQISDTPVSVTARVDLRFIPAVHDDERALIQFRPAIKIYAQALAARDSGKFDDYQRYRNSAIAKLKSQREKKIGTQTHIPNFSGVRSGSRIAHASRR